MENNRYGNINELLDEIDALGDWKDVSQRENFFKVLSKITVIYHGYEIENEKSEVTRGEYPKEVIEAIVKACKEKFPTSEEAFDKSGELKPGCPEYSNYLVLVNNASGISLMGERTRIDEIARSEFGIDVYNTPATREEVEGLIASSKEYLDRNQEQESQKSNTNSKRQEKEESIRKSRDEKQTLKQQILEIYREIKDIRTLLKQKKYKRDELSNPFDEK